MPILLQSATTKRNFPPTSISQNSIQMELAKGRKLLDRLEIRLARTITDAQDARIELAGLRAILTLIEESREER